MLQNNVNTPNAFNRSWADFKNGFGDSFGNYWLGNEAVNKKTGQYKCKLYVVLSTSNGTYTAQHLTYFQVDPETGRYELGVTYTSGNASDGLGELNTKYFSTYDDDNDQAQQKNCASLFGSGWWFAGSACGITNLNGYSSNFLWSALPSVTLLKSQMWMILLVNDFSEDIDGVEESAGKFGKI